MTKPEAIQKAVEAVDAKGYTHLVIRRGDKYDVCDNQGPSPTGWKVAEMVSPGNIHAYRGKW